MGVVLREATDARHAVELAGLLPAVNGAELGETHREIAITVRLRREDLDVMRAVHRLQHEAVEELGRIHDTVLADHFLADAGVELVGELRGNGFEARSEFGAAAAFGGHLGESVGLGERGELRLLIVGEVARGFVEREFADVRREDLRVALFAKLAADEVLQLLANNRAVGRPEDQALADIFVDMEELQIAAEFSVVARFGLFLAFEVLVEFFARGKGGAVDALELLVFLVAAVICAGDGEELEGFQLGGIAHVRAGAEVHEFAVLVEGNFLVGRDVGKAAEFVALLAAGDNESGSFLAGEFFAVKRLVFAGDFLHLGLDLDQIIGGKFMIEVEVVIEAGVGGRTDIEFGVGKKTEDSRREDVRGRVAEFFERGHGHGGIYFLRGSSL